MIERNTGFVLRYSHAVKPPREAIAAMYVADHLEPVIHRARFTNRNSKHFLMIDGYYDIANRDWVKDRIEKVFEFAYCNYCCVFDPARTDEKLQFIAPIHF